MLVRILITVATTEIRIETPKTIKFVLLFFLAVQLLSAVLGS